ncbi:C-X-C chemokine receptor type 3-2-like [Rhineura floridana]|uniref:C-X-C chemokine receptor type 3-2-like n=1 Tax=Rhineura floridana TaxID=261503 RepID=UPI002AC86A58|nr:C-X-C chemokine receptor type 3-2-like [Rhineura floridana]
MSNSFGDYSDYPSEYATGYPDIDPNTAPCTQDEVGAFARYFGPAVFSLAFVVGLVGNGLVLAVLSRRPCPWLFADCYLFQMAVADLLLVLVLPFRATQFTQSWIFGEIPCKLVGLLSTMNSYGTIFLLTCLSVERYLVIVHAIQLHHHLTLSHNYLISTLVWITCFSLSGTELHFRTVAYIPQAEAVICHLGFDAKEAESWRLGLRLVAFFFGFFLPLLVMAICYCRIFRRLYQARIFCKHLAVRLLVVILVLFLLCWGPFHGFIFVDSLQRLGHLARDCAREKMLDFGLLFTESLGLVHCCLNPLVYAFLGVKFQREFPRLFRCWNRDEGPQQSISGQEHSHATDHTTVRGVDYSIIM